MKERIALLTDSACDLPVEIINEFNINVLPLKIIYGNQEFNDRVDIQPDEVYSQMPQKIPTTAMPCLGDISRMFDNLKNKGYEKVLAVHISSGLSGTFDAVRMWAQEVKDMQVHVFDTKVLSIAEGLQVYEAAKDIARGLEVNKIIENLRVQQSKIQTYYVLETLEYLKRGGRIGKVAATVGELLNIKPIISIDTEGKYFTFAKARGRRKSIDKLVELVEQAVSTKTINLAVMHGGALEEAIKLRERLQDLPNIKEIIFGQISPALGVHTGPGLVGICVQEI
ncbi:MAG: DegV family protein [Ignavibacteriales bacterium]